PGTISNNRAGPLPSATGVRSMTTVTYRLPQRVWRHTCSSTPKTRTPVRRLGSSMSNRRPVANTTSLAVCQDTPRLAATRAMDNRSMTTDFNAHNAAACGSLAFGGDHGRGVLLPHASTRITPIPTQPQMQLGWPPAHGHVSDVAHQTASHAGLGTAPTTEIVAVYDATFQRSLIMAEQLTGHRHPGVVQH